MRNELGVELGARPEWLHTPGEHTYYLMMYDGSGGSVQMIEVEREEYQILKERLCTVRNLSLDKEPDHKERPVAAGSLDDKQDCWLASDNGGDTVGLTPGEHRALAERLCELREPKPAS